MFFENWTLTTRDRELAQCPERSAREACARSKMPPCPALTSHLLCRRTSSRRSEPRVAHLAAMPDLWTRFDRRPRTPAQAGTRCSPREVGVNQRSLAQAKIALFRSTDERRFIPGGSKVAGRAEPAIPQLTATSGSGEFARNRESNVRMSAPAFSPRKRRCDSVAPRWPASPLGRTRRVPDTGDWR
jgi:hypothetical protein